MEAKVALRQGLKFNIVPLCYISRGHRFDALRHYASPKWL